ncbi:flavin-containing monooxygenase [Planomonospora corallina]|uniref:Flavin-containing monooxygenase n=1 Tax=Planomonospora corallina TaxID=1806052 RepID=A0ABV8I664_9ACTN
MANSPRIAIIGAGFGGLGMAIRLKGAGVESFTVYDGAEDVGGTWLANTYPGLSCDVPSYLYSFSFAPSTRWSRRYPEQAEILAYLRRCAGSYGLRPHLRLNTEVTAARFEDGTGTWRLTLADGTEQEADVVVFATGQLSRPLLPDIPGAGEFAGTAFHSAWWRHDHDLTGRSVAVIGNGSTAAQFVPRIAPAAGKLTTFQRTPSWVVPKNDFPYRPWARRLLRYVPGLRRAYRWSLFWRQEVMMLPIVFPALGRIAERRWAGAFLREEVRDPELRRRLTPDYPIGCKRVVIAGDYYAALTRPGVELVTEPIERITPTGIRTADGRLHEADTLIYATGFRATEFLAPVEVTGRGGRKLAETWSDGAFAFLGMMVPGFPNLFMMYGPNTNLGHSSIVLMLEHQAEHILRCVRLMTRHRLAWMDVREEAMAAYDRLVQEALSRTSWQGGCTSWYKTASGRVTNNWPFSTVRYGRMTRRPRPEHYHVKAR